MIKIVATQEDFLAHIKELEAEKKTLTECKHERKHDLSGAGITNILCLKCGWHLYNGREFTKAEWEKYVNDFTTPSTVKPFFSK